MTATTERSAPLAAGPFAIGTDLFVTAGLLAAMAADLGIQPADAGWALTVSALGHATGAPLLAALLGGRRARPVLLGSLAVVGLAALATALAPDLTVLLAARAVGAFAAAAHVPAAGAVAVAGVPDERRGRALAGVVGGSSAATVLGAPAAVLLAGVVSWRAAFVLVALITAIAAVLLRRVPDTVLDRTPLAARLGPLRSPAVAGAVAVTALLMAGSQVVYASIDLLPGTEPAPLIAALGIGGLLGTWVGGAATDRWGGRRVVPVAAAVLAAVLALVPALPPGPALVAAVLWGVAAWVLLPAQQHRLLGLRAGPAPVVLALNSSAVQVGFATGAWLATRTGALSLTAAACAVAGLLLHLTTTRRDSS